MHMQYMLHCGVITNDNIEINIREKAHEKGGRKKLKKYRRPGANIENFMLFAPARV